MEVCKSIILIFVLLFCSYIDYGHAAGLSTEFGEVLLEDLEAGESYTISELTGSYLEVENNSGYTIDLKMDILIPQESELRQGYEAMPDVGWIKLETEEFTVEPGASAITDAVISIPDDDEYRGKKYQLYIWSHTVGDKIGVGLRIRFLINIHNRA